MIIDYENQIDNQIMEFHHKKIYYFKNLAAASAAMFEGQKIVKNHTQMYLLKYYSLKLSNCLSFIVKDNHIGSAVGEIFLVSIFYSI